MNLKIKATKEGHKRLRDEFAMAALSGLGPAPFNLPSAIAKLAYEIADAMMEARTKVLDEAEKK